MPSPKFRAGDLVEFVPSGVKRPPGVWYCENELGEEIPVRPGQRALVLELSDSFQHQDEWFFSYKILVGSVLLEASDIMFRKINNPR